MNNDNATGSSNAAVINPQARLQCTTMHAKLQRYHEELTELEHFKNVVPRESLVYFHIGKACEQLNIIDNAMGVF